MNRLTFPVASRYDTRYLYDGTVKLAQFDIEFIHAGDQPWPLFHDMVTKLSYDIAEQPIAHYLIAVDQGIPLTAIPAFPSRFFPQLGVMVNKQAGINTLAELAGRRVACLGFANNPAVWLRWALAHHHDVDPKEIIWVEDAANPFLAGLDIHPAAGYRVEQMAGLADAIYDGALLRSLPELERGVVDAIIAPRGGLPPSETTEHLCKDPGAVIEPFVAATGVFPISTVVTIKQSAVERHPELPTQLLAAFRAARRHYHRELAEEGPAEHMGAPTDLLERLGLFPDSYTLDSNRKSVQAIIEACTEQGLLHNAYEPEDLFAVTA